MGRFILTTCLLIAACDGDEERDFSVTVTLGSLDEEFAAYVRADSGEWAEADVEYRDGVASFLVQFERYGSLAVSCQSGVRVMTTQRSFATTDTQSESIFCNYLDADPYPSVTVAGTMKTSGLVAIGQEFLAGETGNWTFEFETRPGIYDAIAYDDSYLEMTRDVEVLTDISFSTIDLPATAAPLQTVMLSSAEDISNWSTVVITTFQSPRGTRAPRLSNSLAVKVPSADPRHINIQTDISAEIEQLNSSRLGDQIRRITSVPYLGPETTLSFLDSLPVEIVPSPSLLEVSFSLLPAGDKYEIVAMSSSRLLTVRATDAWRAASGDEELGLELPAILLSRQVGLVNVGISASVGEQSTYVQRLFEPSR